MNEGLILLIDSDISLRATETILISNLNQAISSHFLFVVSNPSSDIQRISIDSKLTFFPKFKFMVILAERHKVSLRNSCLEFKQSIIVLTFSRMFFKLWRHVVILDLIRILQRTSVTRVKVEFLSMVTLGEVSFVGRETFIENIVPTCQHKIRRNKHTSPMSITSSSCDDLNEPNVLKRMHFHSDLANFNKIVIIEDRLIAAERLVLLNRTIFGRSFLSGDFLVVTVAFTIFLLARHLY
jgi:hypothetical protein